jgi:hypothetical protein
LALLHGECLHIPLFFLLNEGGRFKKNFIK